MAFTIVMPPHGLHDRQCKLVYFELLLITENLNFWLSQNHVHVQASDKFLSSRQGDAPLSEGKMHCWFASQAIRKLNTTQNQKLYALQNTHVNSTHANKTHHMKSKYVPIKHVWPWHMKGNVFWNAYPTSWVERLKCTPNIMSWT